MEFRLKVLVEVADSGSFTAASRRLFISQPAISKHIAELESYYGVSIFRRSMSGVKLTPQGEVILGYARDILARYSALKMDVDLLSGKFSGELRIAASTTIASYLLPRYLAEFIKLRPDLKLSITTGNTKEVTDAVVSERCDVALVEGEAHHVGLHYRAFALDELVVVTSTKGRSRDEMSLEELQKVPLVLREMGSGTLEVIEKKLKEYNIKLSDLNVILQLGSTEGIKRFLENYPSAYAIISIAAVAQEIVSGGFKVVDIGDVVWERNFSVGTIIGKQNELVENFVNYISYNKKL